MSHCSAPRGWIVGVVLCCDVGCAETVEAPTIPEERFLAELDEAARDARHRCPTWTTLSSPNWESPVLPIDPWGNAVRQSLRARTLRYDGAAARCLIDRVRACVNRSEFRWRGCAPALVGVVPVGGSCWAGIECASGAYCDHGSATSGARACPGTCRAATVPLGGACDPEHRCISSAARTVFCADPSTGASTVSGRCLEVRTFPAGSEGDLCGDALRGQGPVADGVIVDRQCAPGLWCAGTCMRPRREGEACPRGWPPCEAGTRCAAPDPRVCVRSADTTLPEDPLGLPCSADSACHYVLACREGVCRPWGDGNEGSPCARDAHGISRGCGEAMTCERPVGESVGRCAPRRPAGAECRYFDECQSGWCELSTGMPTGRCVERVCFE